ncbi:MAG: P-loop NTPase [Halocynthiibacter sp.]
MFTRKTDLSAKIRKALSRIKLPDGGDLMSRDMVRALQEEDGQVRFVIEAPSPEMAQRMDVLRLAAIAAVEEIKGVSSVSAVLTAHDAKPEPPKLKVGGHPKPQSEPLNPKGVKRVILVGSGKGGVGKSTVSSNLAVAFAQKGHKVGLLDADVYGPSQPRMMGNRAKPSLDADNRINPLEAHGVRFMSIGSMIEGDQAVIWRGPMLMGALQQMLGEVNWGELDVLIVDLPPGTGDVQLTLGQKVKVDGAIIVSTPQDVALIDARKAIDMFQKLKTPIMGLIENMSLYHCPKCGHEAHLFGHGGVEDEAKSLDVPLLAQLPIDLETRQGGDAGIPVALGDGAMAQAYRDLADQVAQNW